MSNNQYSRGSMIRRIVECIKELDTSDYRDICSLIKSKTQDINMINETSIGTNINLDLIDDALLRHMDDMITTKLQRIINRIV
jgi:hypothetical protein